MGEIHVSKSIQFSKIQQNLKWLDQEITWEHYVRPCSFISEMSRNGGDWRGLNPLQASDEIILLQSR
jgi:hypothetical protein